MAKEFEPPYVLPGEEIVKFEKPSIPHKVRLAETPSQEVLETLESFDDQEALHND